MTESPTRVLVVEDDAEDFLLIQKMLARLPNHHFKLERVHDCDEALRKMAEGRFDVCLLDYRLKGRNGLDFLKEVVKSAHNIPVIFLTGQGDYEVDVEAMQLGAADFLYKNKIDGDILERTIRYALERRKGEENKLRLASIIETSNDAIYTVTLEGVILSWNPGAQRIYGFAPEDIGGRDLSLLVPDARQNEFPRLLESIRQGKVVPNFVTTHRTKLGKEVLLSMTLCPIKDATGHVLRASVIARDITESEKARNIQADLEMEREILLGRLQLYLEKMPMAFILTDEQFNHTYWNPAAERMFGYSFHEIVGRKGMLVSARDWEEKGPELREKARSGEGFQGRIQEIIRKDGTTIICEWYGTALKDEEGHFSGMMSMAIDVTERQKAEETIAQNDERFRRIFQDSPVGMALVAGDSKIMMVNPYLCRFVGYSAQELTTRSFAEITHPEDMDKDMEQYLELAAGKIPSYEMDKRYVRKDGKTVWGHLIVTLIRDPSGRPLYGLGMVTDITESRKAEEANKRFLSILEQTTDAMIGIDLEGKVVDWNKGAEQLYGYKAEEVIGKLPQYLKPEEHVAMMDRMAKEMEAGRTTFPYEARRRRKDGRFVDVEATFSVLKNEMARVVGYSVIARDVTERRRAQEVQAQLAAILQQTPDAVIGADLEGNVFSWNRGAETMFGYTLDEISGKPVNLLALPDRHHESQEMREIAVAGESISGFETVRVKKNGDLIDVSITISPIKDSFGKVVGVSAILRDITERKRAEESLHKHEEQMRLVEKMNAIGRLAGGVAHDFNNLLSVIGGNAEFLLSSLEKESPHREEVEEIQKAVHRGADLTKQLLVFGRKQVSQPQPVNLNEMSAELNKMLKRLLDANIDLAIIQDPELKLLQADPGQMQQVLMNLTLNARDAMPRGGSLIIETKNIGPEDLSPQKTPTIPPGHYVRLSVTDNGEGMDPEVQKRIFEPFFTTKAGKGTGLGLATVYGIVQQWKGHILLHSSVGLGTTFSLYFPALDGVEKPASESKPMALGMDGSETILVAEDEDPVRKVLVRTLKKHGYQVLEAPNGIEALQKAWTYDQTIHLLLTDTVMPKMNGKELADELRKTRPQLRVLFISGYPKEILSQQGVLDRGIHLVQKPFELDDLMQQMRKILDEK